MARPKKYTERWLKRLAVKALQYARETTLPLKEDFASKNKFSAQRISEWVNQYPWFAEAIKRFEDICIYKWLTAKNVPPAVKIFTLKNIAGWRDAYDFKHDGKLAETKIQIINYGANNPSSESAVSTSRVAIENSSEV